MNITVEQYFKPYAGHADITHERYANAVALLAKVNALLEAAAADGLELAENPTTGCLISGQTNGGFRPQNCPIGAPRSTHKTGHGIDLYDPQRKLQAWCYANPDRLETLRLTMENGRWTPTWCHLQDIPPGPVGAPWRLDYIPDSTSPKVAALPEQQGSTDPRLIVVLGIALAFAALTAWALFERSWRLSCAVEKGEITAAYNVLADKVKQQNDAVNKLGAASKAAAAKGQRAMTAAEAAALSLQAEIDELKRQSLARAGTGETCIDAWARIQRSIN